MMPHTIVVLAIHVHDSLSNLQGEWKTQEHTFYVRKYGNIMKLGKKFNQHKLVSFLRLVHEKIQ